MGRKARARPSVSLQQVAAREFSDAVALYVYRTVQSVSESKPHFIKVATARCGLVLVRLRSARAAGLENPVHVKEREA